ncbi:fibronectin type III domain-containing protein [Streptomyces sp. G45]|uniref:fibronectin type III domain-containing protein n=1 Tax=Streptomyces sp. G45 TaxID=3406627 RepID=UPI003C165DA4
MPKMNKWCVAASSVVALSATAALLTVSPAIAAEQTSGSSAAVSSARLQPPFFVGASPATPTSIQVYWSPVNQPGVHYEVRRVQPTVTAWDRVDIPTYSATGLKPGTRYTFQVRAVGSDGSVSAPVEASATTPV